MHNRAWALGRSSPPPTATGPSPPHKTARPAYAPNPQVAEALVSLYQELVAGNMATLDRLRALRAAEAAQCKRQVVGAVHCAPNSGLMHPRSVPVG